jgi:hypothetical protein
MCSGISRIPRVRGFQWGESVETLSSDGICLLRRLRPSVEFCIIQNNVLLCVSYGRTARQQWELPMLTWHFSFDICPPKIIPFSVSFIFSGLWYSICNSLLMEDLPVQTANTGGNYLFRRLPWSVTVKIIQKNMQLGNNNGCNIEILGFSVFLCFTDRCNWSSCDERKCIFVV